MTNLQVFEYTIHPHACHFMNHKGVRFQQCFEQFVKEAVKPSNGAEKKQARVVAIEEENEIWDKRVVGWHSPKSI